MRRLPVDSSLFRTNRHRLAQLLGPKTIAIIRSNDVVPANADAFHPFVQNSNLYYLTGIAQAETTLIVFPGAQEETRRELLFIRTSNPEMVIWEGEKLSKEEAARRSRVQGVHGADELETLLPALLFEAEEIALETNEHARKSSTVLMGNERFGQELREQFPLHRYTRLSPLLTGLRMIKQEAEYAEIQKALAVTDEGFRRVLSFVKPGVGEWEVEAELIHEYTRQGSEGFAYDPIVASGKRGCILHYVENSARCLEGELLLMDVAARWNGWNADITRTIPISGTFSARQKEVYEAVLRVMRAAEERLRPGVLLKAYQNDILGVMEKELVGLGLIEVPARGSAQRTTLERAAVKQYFMHGTSHHLGLDVHDVNDPHAVVQQDMVFTIEPGIYIAEENLGIRLENNYRIGRDHNENLSAHLPIEPEEIEALMAT